MKNIILILLFVLITLTVSATDYYIATSANGGSNSNNGSIGSPWLTLTYACSQTTTSGDIIHVGVGTFIETSQSSLAVGVSIIGEGITSIIHSHYSSGNLIELYSTPNAGINGNQSISYLQIEGGVSVSDFVGHSAVKVTARDNVKIHHCTFRNFQVRGVIFWGGGSRWQAPYVTLWPKGCEFYNNIVSNCSQMLYGQGDTGEGALCIGAEQGMLVHNNVITCNLRDSGYNGYCIKYYGEEGVNKGLKIYDNTLTSDTQPTGGGFNFCIEMWANAGGFEIYNNIIHGEIDVVNCQKDLTWYGVTYPEGLYSFGTKIYDNFIGWDSQQDIGNGDGEYGIRLEMVCDYCYIYNNHFNNLGCNIFCNARTGQTQEYIYIYYNIIENVGSSGSVPSKGWGIRPESPDEGPTIDNFHVWNNVISARTGGGSTRWGISTPYSPDGTVTNLSFRNNIIQNFSYAPIACDPADYVWFQNNIYYGNGNGNAPIGTGSLTHFTNTNNVVDNPDFVSTSDFHLTSESPAINAGISVSLGLDYDSATVYNPPEIGAYEYYSEDATLPTMGNYTITTWTQTTISTGGIIINDGGASITDKGVCWSHSINPTTADAHTHNGTGTDQFTQVITALDPLTYYYVRAFATNSVGTEYSFNNGCMMFCPIMSKFGSVFVKGTNGKFVVFNW